MDFEYPLVIEFWNTRCGEIRDQMTKGYMIYIVAETVCYIDKTIRFFRGKNLVPSDKLPR